MRINSFGDFACQPLPEPSPKFYASSLVDEERAVLGSDGKTISKEIVKVSRTRVIPKEEFMNEGVTCDLFNVETQLKAGVQLHEFTADFYGVPLDSREALENLVNSGLDSIESSLSQQGSNDIKFD